MKKVWYVILPVLMLSLVSCATSNMRYSPSEISKFPPKVQEHVKKSELALGMPLEAVRYSWGSPQSIKILPPDEEGNLKEEWVYSKLRFYGTRVVFTNGKVTGIISGMLKKKTNLFKKSPEGGKITPDEGKSE
jgi:hypothetical protein